MKSLYFFLSMFLITLSFKLHGIDLSAWDKTVHWEKLKQQVGFVILRAGTGNGKNDKVFELYYKKCKEYNLPVGAYWYSYAKNVDGAKKEAISILNRLKGKKFEYPIYYDIEEQSIFKTGKVNVSNMLKAFCDILESHKFYCGIYSSKSHLENYFTKEVLNKYDVWVAHYGVKQTTYKGKYQIWQYTGTGKLSGKPGDCDLNWSYFDYPPLIKKRHLNGY